MVTFVSYRDTSYNFWGSGGLRFTFKKTPFYPAQLGINAPRNGEVFSKHLVLDLDINVVQSPYHMKISKKSAMIRIMRSRNLSRSKIISILSSTIRDQWSPKWSGFKINLVLNLDLNLVHSPHSREI